MGRYDNHHNTDNILRAKKKLDKLTSKRHPNIYEIERAKEELETARLFMTCQIFKSFNGRAPNEKVLFSDDNRVMLFCDKLIHYEDIASYKIVEKSKTHLSTVTRQTGTVSRALVGGFLGGGVGAIVGAMSAGSHSTTTQYESADGFYFQIFLKNGEGYQCEVENDGFLTNKIHPAWVDLGTKIQMIIDGRN